jgi:hypothetical protein
MVYARFLTFFSFVQVHSTPLLQVLLQHLWALLLMPLHPLRSLLSAARDSALLRMRLLE